MKEIKRIVLTGGPCAGKTTALVRVIEHFSSRGYKVFTLPEVPTMFTQAGMNYLTKNSAFFYEGEKATLEIQLALEDKFLKMAEACTEPCVIVCDRGTMDISAYMQPELWDRLCADVGYTTQQLRDDRYDAVLHLVSAADGAEQFYTTSNNASRNEAADEKGLAIARMLDKKVIEAWAGHSHLRVINNQEDFNRKLNRVLKEISHVLGLPQTIEEERKYIVEITGELPDCIESEITQTYLVAEPGVEVRLRRRGCLATRKRVLVEVQCQLTYGFVLFQLIPDVFGYFCFVFTYGINIIASTPKLSVSVFEFHVSPSLVNNQR